MDFRENILSAADTIVPSLAADPDAREETCENFMHTYNKLDDSSRKRLGLFITVLNVLSILRFARPFARLDPAERHRFFFMVEHFPIGLIAAGFFGLRSLLLLAYYGTGSAWQRLGYKGPLVKRKTTRSRGRKR